MERRFTFGEVSDLYGAARPNYPDLLFDDVVEAGNITTADTILEIGCGTGQATQILRDGGSPSWQLILDLNYSASHKSSWRSTKMFSLWN